jgi:hypothetical protein
VTNLSTLVETGINNVDIALLQIDSPQYTSTITTDEKGFRTFYRVETSTKIQCVNSTFFNVLSGDGSIPACTTAAKDKYISFTNTGLSHVSTAKLTKQNVLISGEVQCQGFCDRNTLCRAYLHSASTNCEIYKKVACKIDYPVLTATKGQTLSLKARKSDGPP